MTSGHSHHPGDIADHFDQRAATWDDDPEKVDFAQRLAAAIATEVPLDTHWVAMDFGAGTGLLGLALADQVAAMDLLDLSPGMIAVAQQRAATREHVQAIAVDLSTEPAPRAHYDLIVASLSLHHVPHLDQHLARFAELLAPDGWLAVGELTASETGGHHPPEGGLAEPRGHHGFTPSEFASLLQKTGFALHSQVGVGGVTGPSEDGSPIPVTLHVARPTNAPASLAQRPGVGEDDGLVA